MRIPYMSTLAGLAVLASTASPVLAHDGVDVSVRASASANTGVVQVIKDLRSSFNSEAQHTHEETKSDAQVKREALRVKVESERTAKQKHSVKNWSVRAVGRLNQLIERLTKATVKIETRINVLAAAGKNVTQLRADLVTARVKISAAQTALNSMSAQSDVILSASTPKDAFKQLHELEKGVIGKIREAHQALVKLLKDTHSPTPTP